MGARDKSRLAVLPLDNISSDPADEYFADGMTEELISRLSKLSGVTVIGRTSVLKYRGAAKDVAEIGSQLQVGTVLDGSVRKAGSQLRITVQLIDVDSQSQIWSQNFDRELEDVFAIQGEVAEQIAVRLRGQLFPGEQQRLTKQPTANLEAWRRYTEGRIAWGKRTPADMARAINFLNEAIELDPEFALARASLASSHLLFPAYSRRPAKEHMPKARDAALMALELDDSLAEGHAVMASIHSFYDYDWRTAELDFQQALAVDPNHPTTHHWYSLYLASVGHLEEAMKEIQLARQLDPASLIINHVVGTIHYYAGEHQAAVDQYHKTLEIDFNFPITHAHLGRAYLKMSQPQQALDELKLATAQFGSFPYDQGALGYAYAVAGQRGEAEGLLDKLTALSQEGLSLSYDIAMINLGLGNRSRVFEFLEQAQEEREYQMSVLKVDPVWDSLHGEPEFAELLSRMGLGE